LALAGAEAALKDKAHVERCVRENAAERARISGAFEKYGCAVTPSQTNFILVDLARPAEPVYEALLKRGVITRPMKAYGLEQSLRLSFGTRAENDRLIAALAEVLSA
jgi:histidinol-phosphate aminotransferase